MFAAIMISLGVPYLVVTISSNAIALWGDQAQNGVACRNCKDRKFNRSGSNGGAQEWLLRMELMFRFSGPPLLLSNGISLEPGCSPQGLMLAS